MGVVYEINPAVQGKAAETVLYNFAGNGDGANPIGDLVFDPSGNLYGVTQFGGTSNQGTVFELSPPSAQGGAWTETLLYSFQGMPSDGAQPAAGLIFDGAGNLYGTTSAGGIDSGFCEGGCGTAFDLSPPSVRGGSWTENVLYFFQGDPDGAEPLGALIFDQTGNLYGTTFIGGDLGGGTVFELSPASEQGGAWSETILCKFTRESGGDPAAGLVFGSDGTLYGTGTAGGLHGDGTVFRLKPPLSQGGAWSLGVLHNFDGSRDGASPYAALTIGNSRTLYGVNDAGFVFRISASGGAANFAVLYVFDSSHPRTRLTLYNNALYGTTGSGGYKKDGTVFKLSP